MTTFYKTAALAVAGFTTTISAQTPSLLPKTTVPISLTQTLDSNKLTAGAIIHARTTQPITLRDGTRVRAGAVVSGRVVGATAFAFNKTPYAKQATSMLSIQFDRLEDGTKTIPLHVVLRAMADTFATSETEYPQPASDDTLVTHTQVGGDQVVPSQDEVRSPAGDVIGYNRRDGIYAHLIPASGNAPEPCDGSDTEQPMGVFSASACGLYGFSGTRLQSAGRGSERGVITLASTHGSVQIHAHSTALLEEADPVMSSSAQ